MAEQPGRGSEGLAEELRKVLKQAEALLGSIGDADTQDDSLRGLRDRVSESVDAARTRLADLEQQANRVSQRAASATETWVRDNPWTAIAVVGAVGLLLGTLLTRRGTGSEPGSGPEL